MTLLDDVPVGAFVGVDTAPLIYLIEANPLFLPVVEPFFLDRVDKGQNEVVTSVVSLSEGLVQPIRDGRLDLIHAYYALLNKPAHISLIIIRQIVAGRAAELQARHRILLPDALQIALALQEGADVFITNDVKLRRVTVLRVLVLQDYLPPVP